MAAIPTYNNCGNQPCRKRPPPLLPSPSPQCAMHNRPDPIGRPKILKYHAPSCRRPQGRKGNTRQASGHRRAVCDSCSAPATHIDVQLEKVWLNTGCQRPSFATQCLGPLFSVCRGGKKNTSTPLPERWWENGLEKNRSVVAEYIDTSTFCEETGVVVLSLCCWFPHHHHHHENHQHHDHQGRADSFSLPCLTVFTSTSNG
ncbi:hypothetical protein BDP67DRAFT_279933 [Colletotrichum lupini]|nr:hypothetical protein BDP67DRAFT_279933 [Colletotrichum lupini]